MMKLKHLSMICTSMLLALGLSACSKPDVSGTWIPEKVSPDDIFYEYYEIKKMEGTDRYQFVANLFSIQAGFKGDEVPRRIGEPKTMVLDFTKDNTYCVEGSMNTKCVVAVDGGKLDIYERGRFVKSSSNPPKIPVNK